MLDKLIKLDPQIVHKPFKDLFYSNGKLCLTNMYIEQGYNDLYRLANMRQTFSEYGIGQIAYQLLT